MPHVQSMFWYTFNGLLLSYVQALDAAPTDAAKHAAYLAALNKKDPAAVLRVAEEHREASSPAVVVEVCPTATCTLWGPVQA